MCDKLTAYVVTSGCYSDYHIEGVYTDKDKAERYANIHGCDVEEWELDPHDEHDRPGLLPWVVTMHTDGRTSEVRRALACENYKDGIPYTRGPEDDGVSMFMWARSAEHAVKIANERRTARIAAGAWFVDWNEWRKYEDAKRAAEKGSKA